MMQDSKYEEGDRILCEGKIEKVWINRHGKVVYQVKVMQDDVVKVVNDRWNNNEQKS